jgi:hypothetical protein
MQNENVRLGVAFIVGVVVGLGIYWIASQNTSAPEDPLVTNEETASTTSRVQTPNGLIVADQEPGKTVKISELVFKRPGWVAIHDDVDGTPGRILGAKLFDTGTSTDVSVGLLRATVAGKTYLAVLHDDDGQYKTFNPQTDKPLKDDMGQLILVRFQTAAPITSLNLNKKD